MMLELECLKDWRDSTHAEQLHNAQGYSGLNKSIDSFDSLSFHLNGTPLHVSPEWHQFCHQMARAMSRGPSDRCAPQKALLGFEPRISCLLDRRFNQLSHRAAEMQFYSLVNIHPILVSKFSKKSRSWRFLNLKSSEFTSSIQKLNTKLFQVLPRFELGSQDSESWVLTITP